ncbi:MAG: hypothetical protein Q7S44_02975 [bacterium]|nr:hypothetical protein [bacterium]
MTEEIITGLTEKGVLQPWLPLAREASHLTPDQQARANVAFYTRLLGTFSEACKSYQQRRSQERRALARYCPDGRYEGRVLDYYEDGCNIRSLDVLEEMYQAQESGSRLSIAEIEKRWGTEGRVYQDILSEALPSIEQSKGDVLAEVQKWSPRKTFKVALDAASLFPSLSEEQRLRILVLAGYPPEEISKVALRLGLSTALSLSLGQAYEVIGIGSAALGGALRFNQSLGVVLASYALYYGAMLANAEVNLRLLKNKEIGTSPNITATAAYYLLDRLLPKQEKMGNRNSIRDWSARAASLVMEPIKELGWAGTVFIPEVGMSMITAANFAGFGLNTLQAIYARDLVKPENQARIQHFLGETGQVIRHPVDKTKQLLNRFRRSSEK